VPASRARTAERAPAASAVVVADGLRRARAGGPVARYARGADYHDVLERRLGELHAWLEEALGRPVAGKPYVDTGPVLERDLARRAGLGWFGKNAMLVSPRSARSSCWARCSWARRSRPTRRSRRPLRDVHAVPGRVPDGRVRGPAGPRRAAVRELPDDRSAGEVPAALREAVGGRVYGCDVCQDVCRGTSSSRRRFRATRPSRRARRSPEGRAHARARDPRMDVDAYRAAFRGSPMKRAKLRR
jgi:epoxyqueuosine reductase